MSRAAFANPATIRNLGPSTRAWLAAIGVRTREDLERRGAIATYVALKRTQERVSINALYAVVAALDDCDWLEVKRTRKLELVLAVERYEREHPDTHPLRAPSPASRRNDGLLHLRNIGPAMRRDLRLLRVDSVAELARREPDELYLELQRRTRRRHDPCVWDTFAAAIHQARTGEALPWWHFTCLRKARQAEGTFAVRFTQPAGGRSGSGKTGGRA